MPRRTLTLASLALILIAASAAFAGRHEYPKTKMGEVSDTFHGTTVADPFRWLENDVRQSDDVRSWVTEQNELTFGFLESIPERETIRKRMTELWNYEKISSPFRVAGRYYYWRNDGLQNQSVLYGMDTLGATPKVVLDPNSWSEDGTVALASYEFSANGRYIAYGRSEAGSDWQTWYVRDVRSGRDLPDRLSWVKFSDAAWTRDGLGFFYSRFEKPAEGKAFQSLNKHQQVYYHRVGTDQADDVLVFKRPDQPDWGYGVKTSEDGRWLVISVWVGTDPRNRVLYKDLGEPYGMPVELIDNFDQEFSFLGNDGPRLYFRTDLDAPRRRVIAIDVNRPEREHWREVVAEEDEALRGVGLVGNFFVANYLRDATSLVRVFRTDGSHVRDVELPGLGSASGFGGRRSDTETFFSYSSFNRPTSIYRYDLIKGESTLWRQATVDFDPDEFVVRQVFYRSKDGTRVPMFIAHHRDVKPDGTNPTLLYGYGGFNIPLTPSFSVSRLAWMEMGGVFAMANLRGGGEYGVTWHKAGTKLDKQNVFDDFIAAAEWLIENKYTSSERLAIQGRSNGGLLVGAAMTQRPELFGAALPGVGVMDMLRFHRFTAGRYWVDDYGSADDPAEFRALHAYSPYHNLKPGTVYPATMVVTADTDDRVVPGHSFKFAAALQQAHAGDDPVMIRIETRAGHGAGKPTHLRIEEAADEWAFLVRTLGFEPRGAYAASRRRGGGRPAAAVR